MGSSKKKGQQRRAAKKALSAEAARSGGGIGGSNSKIVARIRSGDNKTTKRLFSELVQSGEEIIPLVSSGALSIVLDFLNRCEAETFEGVMTSVGGDLKTPSTWLGILVSASFVEPSCKLQIAESIGPLARCMCNDTERKFFKNNRHWREGIRLFVNMVLNVMEDDANNSLENERIIDTVLQHDGLLTSIIQMRFWKDHRPDIVKELRTGGMMSTIISMSRTAIDLLLGNDMEGESRIQLLKTIGTTPVINQAYDANCMVSFTAELVRGLKCTDQRDKTHDTLQLLMREADCIDKEVITEIIKLGTNAAYTSDYRGAHSATLLSLRCMYQGDNNNLNDTRTAFAIRVGLIEMCLGFIERYGEHESFGNDNDESSLYNIIGCIFQDINNVSLHQKSAKAIRVSKWTLYYCSCSVILSWRRRQTHTTISNASDC